MGHLLAAMANDAEHMPSLLHTLRGALAVPEEDAKGEVWGVGYYADDHALIIRKPGDLLPGRSFYELASKVRSHVLLAFLRSGVSTTAHAPPYRFRRWLFGYVGELGPLEQMRGKILDALPDFVRSELADAGAGELACGMFLRELHRTNGLSDPLVDGRVVADAMKRTVDAVQMLATEAGIPPLTTSFAATNGRTVVASNTGEPIHWKLQEGLEALHDGPLDPSLQNFQLVVNALRRFRAIVIGAAVTDAKHGWNPVAPGKTIWFDRSLTVTEA